MPDIKGSASKIKMPDVDALFGIGKVSGEARGQVEDVEISKLRPFKNHPFRVIDDEKMQEMVESIREYGILNPVLARPTQPHGYEIIAGHRRKRACEILGLKKIPCMIREMSDEEATITMVDSNIQREKLLFSEKAFAYRMKLEAIKQQGKRNDLTCGQIGHRSGGAKSVAVIAEEMGESQKQVQRYIRLTYLEKPLLEYVDDKRIPFNAGVELSYLTDGLQKTLLDVISRVSIFPNLVQSAKMREMGRAGNLDADSMELILGDMKPRPSTVKLNRKKLDGYFPKGYSNEQIEEVILALLQKWSLEQETGTEN